MNKKNYSNRNRKSSKKAIGPYSQAILAGDYLFLSGQLSIDPVSGVLTGLTIQEQTAKALDNVEAILSSAGLSLENVVRVEVYLKNMDDFKEMNQVYAQRFSGVVKPARHLSRSPGFL